MGLILPRWVLILPRIPPPTPVLYSAVTNPFRGYVRTQNTPTPPQNTPFPELNLKVGKMIYCLGNVDPNWAKCLKNGQNFSRSGQKKYSCRYPLENARWTPVDWAPNICPSEFFLVEADNFAFVLQVFPRLGMLPHDEFRSNKHVRCHPYDFVRVEILPRSVGTIRECLMDPPGIH